MPRRKATAENYTIYDKIELIKCKERSIVTGFGFERKGIQHAGIKGCLTLFEYIEKVKMTHDNIAGFIWLIECKIAGRGKMYRRASDLRLIARYRKNSPYVVNNEATFDNILDDDNNTSCEIIDIM